MQVKREAQPLPRGRHGIEREDIRAHQRGRISDATIECVAERGYAPTTVGHIVARARVSRETFYELYADKESCYRESLDATIGDIHAAFAAATADTDDPPAVRLERGLRDYFEALAARPALAICFILERPSSRHLTAEEADSTQEIVRRYADVYGHREPFVIECYLALIDGVVRRYVRQDRTEDLPGAVDDLMPVVKRVLMLED